MCCHCCVWSGQRTLETCVGTASPFLTNLLASGSKTNPKQNQSKIKAKSKQTNPKQHQSKIKTNKSKTKAKATWCCLSLRILISPCVAFPKTKLQPPSRLQLYKMPTGSATVFCAVRTFSYFKYYVWMLVVVCRKSEQKSNSTFFFSHTFSFIQKNEKQSDDKSNNNNNKNKTKQTSLWPIFVNQTPPLFFFCVFMFPQVQM